MFRSPGDSPTVVRICLKEFRWWIFKMKKTKNIQSREYSIFCFKNCKLTYASSSGDRSPSPSTSNNRYALSFAWQSPTVVSRANNRTWTLCGTKLFFRTVLDANARAVLWKKVFIFFKFSFVSRGKKRNDVDLILNETRAGVAPNSLHDLGL